MNVDLSFRKLSGSYLSALILLALFFVIIAGYPDAEGFLLVLLSALLYTAVMVSLRATGVSSRTLVWAAGAAALMFLARLTQAATEVNLTSVRVPVDVILLIATPVAVLVYVLRQKAVSANVIFGALVVYFFIGLLFGIIFEVIADTNPGAFSFTDRGTASVYYFSFVTLTTLGYGDIAPVAEVARSFAVLEAFIGQVFMVVLVARPVGLHTTGIRHERSPEE